LIEQNQQSITEQISSMSKTNSDTIEKILTQSLKKDTAEIELVLSQHRAKIRKMLSSELKKQMTVKMLDLKYQTIIMFLLGMNLILIFFIIIRLLRM
ncbi:hypothetical protein, partial [Klebsiella quasipneumoniae]|uniref:hypothetical protein n=1 Tax=Klebsiella quasipneumoniae TaxID=1463165 RepID=UPI003F6DBF71